MSKKYTNNQIFQSGIQFNTQFPLDDRLVLNGWESLYISTSSSSPYYYNNADTLYGKAYSGMPVIIHITGSNDVYLLILKNAEPYTPGHVSNITADNYKTYWELIGSGDEQHIYEVLNKKFAEIDTSISNIRTSVSSLNSSMELVDESLNDVNASISTINSSIHYVETSLLGVNTSIESINDSLDVIDASFGTINSSILDLSERINSGEQHYNDTKLTDDSFSTLTPHGNLPAGVTVGQLKSMTLSQILTKILFEVAKPTRVQHAYVTIKWKSDSIYKNVVDVGVNWPSASEMEVTYYPEKYNWISAQNPNVSGTPIETTRAGDSSVLYNNGTWNTTNTVDAGTFGTFTGRVASVAGSNAKDSLGNETDTETGQYYRSGVDAAADRENRLVSSINSASNKSLSFTAAWRYYSNASETYTSASSAWSNKSKENIADYKGNSDTIQGDFVYGTDTKTIWLQWPKLTASQHCYVYIPNGYKISKVAGASDVNVNQFNVGVVTNPTEIETTTITNSKNSQGVFKKYEITKMSNITTVEIKIDNV